MKETFVFSVKKDTRRVEVSNHWKYCVGSGQAKLAMRSDYARQLKFIHDELGIERVRFHGFLMMICRQLCPWRIRCRCRAQKSFKIIIF